MTATEVLAILQRRHDARTWAFFPELRLGTGYGSKWEQRIDAWAICYYPSKGLQRIAYEIKVSRGDWLAELKQPQKRAGAMEISNLFYFVAPPGVIREDEVPDGCGLMTVCDGDARKIVEAPYRDCAAPPWRFVASLARRLYREESG